MHRDMEQKWNNFGETSPVLLEGAVTLLLWKCFYFRVVVARIPGLPRAYFSYLINSIQMIRQITYLKSTFLLHIKLHFIKKPTR